MIFHSPINQSYALDILLQVIKDISVKKDVNLIPLICNSDMGQYGWTDVFSLGGDHMHISYL